ncbi:sigma-70 family RNA polymerase sigma factor [Catenulispora sp. NF23]|uniref:RNA polymerase sigma factor n=1 Tax=Catenulispora pinistramenti TaxID=2705254 RepID=UPI001BAA60D1|nr:sigma-70 family RNA polymerase sigma factor [Catenulispora pinistramenti]MBS2538534.1 sigma-70 family RNA polymerase sigma factor [Catenulispora pinistramenti]
MDGESASEVIAGIYADGWSRIVATMIRFTGGDWDLAEECAQDAFTQALRKWPGDGIPRQPLAWLTTTARNRAVDRMRRASTEAAKLRAAAREPAPPPYTQDSEIPDERLELMFTCCHPALRLDAQVALTLRSLAGLSTAEIARAFLVSERTMGQRVFRAKQKVAHAVIPFRVPSAHLLPDRLPAVLHVLYLLFNRGYDEPRDPAHLGREAIRLARVLVALMPDEPEAQGLLALMLVQEARRASRFDEDGEPVILEDQDRSRWDRELIGEGGAILERALRRRRAGPFQIQAAIAACHAAAPSTAETDWPQIAGLYDELAKVAPGPVVDLNRAVALAMAEGPEAALAEVDALAASGRLDGYHLLAAARADLLRRVGRAAEAHECLREAIELAPSEGERRLLRRRLADW